MSLSTPVLDIYFIDFSETSQKAKGGFIRLLKKAAFTAALGPLYRGAPALLAMLYKDEPSLKRLIDEKRFHVITTQDELDTFKNPDGYAWKQSDSALKKRQYYIRHPKCANRNLLIEAQNFHQHIEEERKDELIQFIHSHCCAKKIQIDRIEISDTDINANGQVNNANLSGSVAYGKQLGNYYDFSTPVASQKAQPRNEYLWLENSLMQSIEMLSPGATLKQLYNYDLTFGLSVKEAKILGLNLDMHKKYSFSIYIEC